VSAPHLESQFSAAYDGTLTAEERRGFDIHLAACPVCARAFAEMSAAVDAVRELGTARMPRPVVLPEGPPGVEEMPRRRWLAAPLRHPWAAGLVGAVAAAALVLALVIPRVTGPGPLLSAGGSESYARPLSGGTPAVSAPSADAPNGPCSPCASGGASSATRCPVPVPTGSADPTAIPPGYNNRVVRDDGTTTVVLATNVSSYSPGETVEIYARLVDDRTGRAELPCAYLLGLPTGGVYAIPAGPGHAQSGEPGAVAAAASGTMVNGAPTELVAIPATASSGQTLQVAVDVPTVGAQAAHQVLLSISVT
jgi:hypothetical protein